MFAAKAGWRGEAERACPGRRALVVVRHCNGCSWGVSIHHAVRVPKFTLGILVSRKNISRPKWRHSDGFHECARGNCEFKFTIVYTNKTKSESLNYLYLEIPPTWVGGILTSNIPFHAWRTFGTQDGYQIDQLVDLNDPIGPCVIVVPPGELTRMTMSCVNRTGVGGILALG